MTDKNKKKKKDQELEELSQAQRVQARFLRLCDCECMSARCSICADPQSKQNRLALIFFNK